MLALRSHPVELEHNVLIEHNVLTLSGERKAEREEMQEGFYRLERAFGTFSRSLTLPKGIDPEAVTAGFENGVLEVRVPKPEQRKPRKITIAAREGEAQAIEGAAA